MFFDNNNFQNVINTVESNRELLNFPYAKFLYGLSIWYSERVKNIEKAEPILIEAIRSANTYDSANGMANYAADLTGIEVNTPKAAFKYDMTECVLKKDDTEFNKDTAVYLTDLGTSIVYINANDGCLYSVDLKDFSKKKVFSEKANSVYLCNDKRYVASDRTVHILNSSTFAKEDSFRATITATCSAENTVYYLENNGHANRINSNGKHDKLSSHVVAMAVVGNKIIFNGKKGLTIANINIAKQKVGFLRRSFLTNERYVSGSAPMLLLAFDDVVYYTDNSSYGTVDIINGKIIPSESISLISIYNTNSAIVGTSSDFKQISLKK